MQTATSAVPVSASSERRADGGVLAQGAEKSKTLRRAPRHQSSPFRVLLSVLSVLVLAPLTSYAQAKYPFDLPAQPLAESLRAVGHQTSTNVMFEPRLVKGLDAPALRTETTPTEAIRLLLAGTKLTALQTAASTVLIQRVSTSENSAATSQAVATTGTNGYTRLAQAEPTLPVPSSPGSQTQKVRTVSEESVDLGEVVVTGSRLRVPYGLGGGPQSVQSYSREDIDRSGRTSVSEFLTTLPQVSVSAAEGRSLPLGGTSVQLRGLPLGTTLVLVNGRRVVSASGPQTFNNFFDLNTIPAAAIERIDVLAEAASAAYGSDAIGGVVNLVLREDFDGFEFRLKYGAATQGGIDETNASLAWGHGWEHASLSMIATYQTRSELTGSERKLSASADFRPYGGNDLRSMNCYPGNVFSVTANPLPGVGATSAGVPATLQGTATQADFVPTAGILNRCTGIAQTSVILPNDRTALLVSGVWNITPRVDAFAEALFSRNDLTQFTASPSINVIVPATNPYNPFGVNVRARYAFGTLGRGTATVESVFVRPLIGLRARFLDGWEWEATGWSARQTDDYNNPYSLSLFGAVNPITPALNAAITSTNPATALNPFTAGPPGSQALLDSLRIPDNRHYYSRTVAANTLVRGPLLSLPAGPVQTVLGAEYFSDGIRNELPALPAGNANDGRSTGAAFAEARVPLLGARGKMAAERLAISLAGRYDRYSDRFEDHFTGQAGLEWRPVSGLLVRGNFAESFRAPALFQLSLAAVAFQQTVADPLRGGQSTTALVTQGGNQNLEPESGESRTFGVVYSSDALPYLKDFQASLTHWNVELTDRIAPPAAQTIVTNESLFPGRVLRGPEPGGSDPFPTVGPVTAVDTTFANLSQLEVRGVDLSVSWRHDTPAGAFSPSLAVTNTYRYQSVLVPNAPVRDLVGRADTSGYAPRWKGTAGLRWNRRGMSSAVTARFLDDYIDYSGNRTLEEQWFIDLNLGWDLSEAFGTRAGWLSGTRLSLGAVNLLDEEPQFASNGVFGYDTLQADLRGRFAYASVDVRW